MPTCGLCWHHSLLPSLRLAPSQASETRVSGGLTGLTSWNAAELAACGSLGISRILYLHRLGRSILRRRCEARGDGHEAARRSSKHAEKASLTPFLSLSSSLSRSIARTHYKERDKQRTRDGRTEESRNTIEEDAKDEGEEDLSNTSRLVRQVCT